MSFVLGGEVALLGLTNVSDWLQTAVQASARVLRVSRYAVDCLDTREMSASRYTAMLCKNERIYVSARTAQSN